MICGLSLFDSRRPITIPLNKKTIAKGIGVAFVGLAGSLLTIVQPVPGVVLCVVAFLMGAVLVVQGEVEKALRDEQIDSVTRILSSIGLGNAPHDAFERVVRETGDLATGVKHLQDALQLEPDNPKYHAEMAAYFALLVSSRANCGLRQIPAMIANGKKHAKWSMKKGGYQALAHVAMGMLLDNEGHYREAQRYFRKAGIMGDPWHHIYLCTSYCMAGEFSMALKEIEQHRHDGLPGGWIVYRLHGLVLLRTGHYREAEAQLRKALDMRGAFPGLALALSESIYMQGRFLAANRFKMREVLLLLAVHPKRSIRLLTDVVLHDAVYVLTTVSRAIVRRLKETSRLAGAVSRVIPPYEPHATLSDMAYGQGHIAEAYDLLKEALVFGSREARLWGNLGAVCVVLGRHTEASDACKHAQELEPGNPAWQQLAQSIQAAALGTEPIRLIQCSQKKGKDGQFKVTNIKWVKVLG